jgi:hypothetical protein
LGVSRATINGEEMMSGGIVVGIIDDDASVRTALVRLLRGGRTPRGGVRFG